MPIVSGSEFASLSSSLPFDYVIVGGGTSGLVVAARLTENPDIIVGVIEAGPYIDTKSEEFRTSNKFDMDIPGLVIPGLAGTAQNDKRVIWDYVSTPQTSADGQTIPQPRGKILGGSSAINILAWGRGCAKEYDALEMLGNPGWNWESLLPYFQKSETFHQPNSEFAEKYNVIPDMSCHGLDGPIQVSYPAYIWEGLSDPFIETLNALGVETNHDPASGSNIGASFCTSSTDPKTLARSYATTAYYEPNAHRRNLYVVTDAVASKILFRPRAEPECESEDLVATGIEFICGGEPILAKASMEVILAAGSFNTPQLLELSGIGQKSMLEELKIPQLINLPGDHVFVVSSFEMAPEIKTSDSLNDPTVSNEELKLYMDKKDSQLSTIHLTFAFMPLDKVVAKDNILKIKSLLLEETKNNKKFPASDKQYKLLGDWLQSDEMSQIEIFQRPHLRPGAVKPVPGKKYQTLVASSMHPFSRGSVHITSNSPLSPPAIDPQYLSHPIDVEIMAHSVRYTRQIAQTAPLTDKIIGRLLPGDEILLDDDIAKWKDVVRRTMGMGYHPVGTASMLPREDDGVVSSKLLVHGTENVRVVDASIIPMQISHHTQATVYAFAEKAADIIKEAYNQTK